MNDSDFENFLVRKTPLELIKWMQNENYLKREMCCQYCFYLMRLQNYYFVKEEMKWRCLNKTCVKYKHRISIRKDSFFESLTLDFLIIFKVIIRYSQNQCLTLIEKCLGISRPSLIKIKNEILTKIGDVDFSSNKLGGPGKIIQLDETMLNYKCKSHRCRSPHNKTDALVIVECDPNVKRVFAIVIENRLSSTLIPIISRNLVSGSTVYTDEHRSYNRLNE